MQLRSYQHDIIKRARELMLAGERRLLIQAPTGSGKTVLTAHMLKTAAKKGFPSWFTVHRRELVKQSIKTFSDMEINHGVISASFMEYQKPLIQIASIQTLINRHARFKKPRLIIWDECHHLAARSWKKIFDAYPDAFHIGLTATPCRLDGRGLSEFFSYIIEGPPTSKLIDQGYLSPYKLYAPSKPSLDGLHTRMGDWIKSELTTVIDKPSITGDVIKEYKKRADGKRAVVFCVSIEHSKHVVEQFLAAGIPAVHVDGETDEKDRDQAIEKLASGEIKILSNVDLFGEGFDLPAIECGILLRPTQSLGLYLQQIGRTLRAVPGKDYAIILDHSGNCERHGMPCEEREWTLEGRARTRKKDEEKSKSVKVCPNCFAAQFAGKSICKFCFSAFEKESRQVEEREGDLVEVDVRREKRKEQAAVNSMADLIALGKQRGYRNPYYWARQVFMGRQRKKVGM